MTGLFRGLLGARAGRVVYEGGGAGIVVVLPEKLGSPE
jgi:hypothetical protein